MSPVSNISTFSHIQISQKYQLLSISVSLYLSISMYTSFLSFICISLTFFLSLSFSYFLSLAICFLSPLLSETLSLFFPLSHSVYLSVCILYASISTFYLFLSCVETDRPTYLPLDASLQKHKQALLLLG